MSQPINENPVPGRCNKKKDDGGFCHNYPAKDEDGSQLSDNGYCYHHVERNDGTVGVNYTHGIRSNRSSYYRNQPASDQALIDAWIESFLTKASWDESHTGNMELLRSACIDLHKIRATNDYIDKEGLTQDKVIDSDEFGDEIESEVENILNVSKDRLSRDVRSTLKDLGVLDNDDDVDEEIASLSRVFSKLMSE